MDLPPRLRGEPHARLFGDPEQEYFVDGMVEDIITGLSRIKWLIVNRPQFELHLQGQGGGR